MKLTEIEVHQKYECDFEGKRYFAEILRKNETKVCVRLLDVVDKHGSPGDPIDRGGLFGELWLSPDHIHQM